MMTYEMATDQCSIDIVTSQYDKTNVTVTQPYKPIWPMITAILKPTKPVTVNRGPNNVCGVLIVWPYSYW